MHSTLSSWKPLQLLLSNFCFYPRPFKVWMKSTHWPTCSFFIPGPGWTDRGEQTDPQAAEWIHGPGWLRGDAARGEPQRHCAMRPHPSIHIPGSEPWLPAALLLQLRHQQVTLLCVCFWVVCFMWCVFLAGVCVCSGPQPWLPAALMLQFCQQQCWYLPGSLSLSVCVLGWCVFMCFLDLNPDFLLHCCYNSATNRYCVCIYVGR